MISQKTRSSLKITIGTILVIIGTLVIVSFSSGYNIDIFRGEIFSTGLVLLNSNPGGASININGKTIPQKTPHRIENFRIGEIKVNYQKNDYQNWSASFFVRPGQVTFADYALLIPNNIEQSDNFSKTKLDNLLTSTERNRVFGLLDNPGTIYELDRSNQPKKIVELPVNPAIQAPNRLTDAQLSRDGSSLLIKANYPEGPYSYLWVDTSNGQFVNFESLLGQKPNDLKFNQRNSKEFYNLFEGKLRRINIETKQVLDLNLSSITSYQLDKEYLYTLENLSSNAGQLLVRYDFNGNNRYVLSQLAATDSPREITASEYNGQKLLSIRTIENGEMTIFRQYEGKNLTSGVGLGVRNVSYSPDGRFISFLQSDDFKTIDIETGERFNLKSQKTSSIKWLTNYQAIITRPDGLYIIDFNGFNLVKIPPNSSDKNTYKFTTQIDNKSIYYSLDGNLSYYSLQPKGLINFR